MLVANPLYDVFFKYLLEDNRIARMLLSAILEADILDLILQPQEIPVSAPTTGHTVVRMDFCALIRTKEHGTRKVLIEMQKSRTPEDIPRFRAYLGENYARQDPDPWKSQKRGKITADGTEPVSLPVATIYFLNFKLEGFPCPVLKSQRTFTNFVTKEIVVATNPFVEKLTHDSWFIQIPHLVPGMKSRVEKLLSVFNQTFVMDKNNKTVLDIPDSYNDDPEVAAILNRLSEPLKQEILVKKARAEEELFRQYDSMAKQLAALKQETVKYKEELKRKQEKDIKQQEELERSREEAIRQQIELKRRQEEAIRQQEELERSREEAIRQQEELKQLRAQKSATQKLFIKMLLEQGKSWAEVAALTGLEASAAKRLYESP